MQLKKIQVVIKTTIPKIKLTIDSFIATFKISLHHIDFAVDRIFAILSVYARLVSTSIERATCNAGMAYLLLIQNHIDISETSINTTLLMQTKLIALNLEVSNIRSFISMQSSIKHTDYATSSIRTRVVRPVLLGDLSGKTLGELSGMTLGDLSAIDIT